MKEVIVRLKGDHVKVKNGEYVRDLVRCNSCGYAKYREDHTEYLCLIDGEVHDADFFCGDGSEDER